jgi:hypothetical protein
MAGGKTNTQRIETLESQAANLSARLDVLDKLFEGIAELLKKCAAAAEGHGSKLMVIEERLVLVDLKTTVATIASIKEDVVAMKKDIEGLGKWKEELKKEKEERARRAWAFGPNVTAALITIVMAPLVLFLWNYLFALFRSPNP